MRHFIVRVPKGQGQKVVQAGRDNDALSIWQWQGQKYDGEVDIVDVEMSNRSVGPFLDQIGSIDDMTATLYPNEIINFVPPASRAPQQLRNLEPRSPLEIYLLGIQSIGNWSSFLAYAVTGAILVWIAFYTNTIYVLIAAMLIAPFASPAMNVAMATATSDMELFRENMGRYFVAVGVTALIGGLLSLILQQNTITSLMRSVGYVSGSAVLLPLIAGIAGATNLVQSERSSLVSGTAVGLLVAASLAPSAGLLGISLAMQRWDLVLSTGFLLMLQLVGINLGGTVIFRWYGLKSRLPRYDMGQKWLFYASSVVTGLALVGLLVWQSVGPPQLRLSSQSTRAAEVIQTTVERSELAAFVNADVNLLITESQGQNTLLATVYVESQEDTLYTNEVLADRLRQDTQRALQEEMPQIQPLVNVVVLTPLDPAQAGNAMQ